MQANQDWKEKYFALLNAPKLQEASVTKALAIKRENFPPSLFRFRPLNLNTLSEIRKNYIWLASPDSFNDPFDSSLSVSYLKPLLLAAGIIPMSVPAVSSMIEQGAKKKTETLKQALITSLRICCFCQRNDSIVMWSHYAANHQGICIEYDAKEFLANKLVLKKLHPVIYKGELFAVSPNATFSGGGAEQNPLLATIAACHKSREWSYEEEWRLVSPVSRTKQRSRKVRAKSSYIGPEYILTYRPKVIFLGAKIPEKAKDLITAIAADVQVPVFQASLAWNGFRLEFAKA
jgi:hypothetical protein